MQFLADLHIHSKYSRATSSAMTPETIWKWAQYKGINVIGTGDFTHPAWLGELNEKLEPRGNGLFSLRKEFRSRDIPTSCSSDISFLLSAEISCIYSKNGKTRKVHSIVFVPDLEAAARMSTALSKIGNISADGRPILGLDTKELLKIAKDSAPGSQLIPAHAWTPHFSVFGAVSGFDSLEECFEDMAPHIHAIETGLSSDPLMNRKLSALDSITLISNSDAHSPVRIGREANIFHTTISYQSMCNAIRTGQGFQGTLEFFPEEGKYHYDGHRACKIRWSPAETLRHDLLCPECGKKVTVGVLHRVETLADRKNGHQSNDAPFFSSVLPLSEILSEIIGVGVNTKRVTNEYFRLLERLGPELHILMDASLEEIEASGSSLLSEAISRMRSGRVHIVPGYDGEYGKIHIFDDLERKKGILLRNDPEV